MRERERGESVCVCDRERAQWKERKSTARVEKRETEIN